MPLPEQSAEEYFDHHYARHSGAKMHFVSWLQGPAGRTTLDVGCGNGALAASLHAAGMNTLGVDLSEYAVALASAAHPEIAFQQIDERPLDEQLGQGRWDVITCAQVIEHIPPEHVNAFIGGLARSLRPGGQMLIDVPITDNVSDRWLMFRNIYLRGQSRPIGAIDSSLNPTHLWKIEGTEPFLARFTGHGLEIERIRELYYVPWTVERLGWSPLAAHLPERMLDSLLKGLTILFVKGPCADYIHTREFSAFWSELSDTHRLRRLKKLFA